MTWIVSDIHGCFHTLIALLQKILSIDSNPSLVFVGDYVDRGRYSKEVISYLIELKQKYNCTFLCGNHDDVINFILNKKSYSNMKDLVVSTEDVNIFNWWSLHGLLNTIDSYGVKVEPGKPMEMLTAFREIVPVEHKNFFDNLEIGWQNDKYFAVHAYMDISYEIPRDFKFFKKDQYTNTLWGRFQQSPVGGVRVHKEPAWGKIGVFGHTPTKVYLSPVPIKQGLIRLIDTGSFIPGGYLTGFNCEEDTWILQATVEKDVKNIDA